MAEADKVAREKLKRLSVEFNLGEHCNLSCYNCDHASPLLPTKYATVEGFTRDLEALAEVFHSEQFRIVGGEPLMHPQLLDFLSELRRIKIADATVVITNGVLLGKVPNTFWTLIDQLWISVYPGIKLGLSIEECQSLCKTHGVFLRVDEVGRFQKTLLNSRIEDPELVAMVFRECGMAGEYSCNTIHEGRLYRCSIAPFMAPRLALQGIAFENRSIDGVELHDNPQLYEDVERCLFGQTPLAACDYCLGTSAPWTPHRQLNLRGRAEWQKEDSRPVIEEVSARLLGRPGT